MLAGHHMGDQPAGARGAGSGGGVHLHLDDVARLGHRGAGGGAGQDDIALFEGHQLREIGHELAEGEDQALGGVVLDELCLLYTSPSPRDRG